MIEKYPLIPLLIFAGALVSTATIGLPVFAGWINWKANKSNNHLPLIERKENIYIKFYL